MSKPFRPMLATDHDPSKLVFPYNGSPKLDGIRGIVIDGVMMSRSMKPIPNKFVQFCVERAGKAIEGFDGELIVGAPYGNDVYQRTSSGVMSREGRPDFTYNVFDHLPHGEPAPWVDRWGRVLEQMNRITSVDRLWAKPLVGRLLSNQEEMRAYEAECLEIGYEGIMIRDQYALYKQGRSTVKENGLLKVKRFSDAEARIIGYVERMHNGNEATTDELGRTKRSSHQENKTGRGDLGAWVCVGVNGGFQGVDFTCGSGMTDAQRADFWARRDEMIGTLIRYKFFDIGIKDAPRFPIFRGVRNYFDMDPSNSSCGGL